MSQPTIRHTDRGYSAEVYSHAKLRDDLAYFCTSVGSSEGATLDIVDRAAAKVTAWLEGKTEVTSDDLRRVAGETLELLCPEAGYLYKNENSIM